MNSIEQELVGNLEQQRSATLAQSSQGLVMQSYALSVKEQGEVNLASSDRRLQELSTKANDGLRLAQQTANNYLDRLQPSMLNILSDFGGFSITYKNMLEQLPTVDKASARYLIDQSLDDIQGRLQRANTVKTNLRRVADAFAVDSGRFTSICSEASVIWQSNDGVLGTLRAALEQVDSALNQAYIGIGVSVFGVVGGLLLVGIGAAFPPLGAVTAPLGSTVLVGSLASGTVVLATAGMSMSEALSQKNACRMSY
ncbi:HBL/NHE enterotoxin family protein [Pseudomonas typographi]|uniref:HBL/NHE enterotoxin family protein n=1 Tax=Pseudomonas typographi TaxID=2715964 RepID=UPI00168593CF|nr:HBL/NHE enterotoxin family protein [Pseudomonas typographi]MBD1587079.1 alpha-helical pore-forming toxin family protein [Pseudomonas typographi]